MLKNSSMKILDRVNAEGVILVLSDSHGDVATMIDIIAHWEKEIDAVVFTGDGAEDLIEAAYIFDQLPFFAVKGNNDFNLSSQAKVSFPLEQTISLLGQKIYLTHGHIAHYSAVRATVLERAKEAGATIALYGHLHIPEVYSEDNIFRFNPGSIAYPRGQSLPSYLILKVAADDCDFTFFHAKSHQKIEISLNF